MKRLITLTLLTFAIAFCCAQDKNVTDQNGKKQGFWEETVRSQTNYGYYKDGQKDGMWTYLNNRGTLSKIENYRNGKLDGMRMEFEPTYGGSVTLLEQYNQGVLNGRATNYSYNRIIGETDYEMGKLNGLKRVFYKTGGEPILQEESYYTDDVLDGTSTWYSNKGVLLARYNFKNGEYDGEQITYYDYNKTATKELYKNGIQVGEYVEYYESGNVKLEGIYENGLREGNWTEYDDSGKVIKVSKYKKGVLK